MSKLPAIKRFTREDYQGAPDWLDKLFYTLNLFMSSVYSALNSGLTINDNSLGLIKTMTVKGASPTTSFRWDYLTQPVGLIVARAYQTDGTASPITNAVYADWTYSQNIITVNNITGLNSAHTYSITFLVFGG